MALAGKKHWEEFSLKYVLGIDTGGTYTDAVLYDADNRQVVASGKAPTTRENLAVGIGVAIDRLPMQELKQAAFLSLSTTLATNACVEDRGGRAKLIFIGAEQPVVAETGWKYGLPDAEEILFLDAEIRSDGTVEREPDWQGFLEEAESFLKDADSVAVVAYQGIRNPTLEQAAKKLIRERFGLFTVCGHELFWNLNYLKRGAGALLNARLVPIITDFLQAIHETVQARGIDIPIVIVRSDGTLMTEKFALERPVETILCGPAASILGGVALSGSPDCIVVDMGGTTTDIAMVLDGKPVKRDGGISIGKWDTFVDSAFIHTLGLGGDSRVRIGKEGLLVGPERIMPLCAAASRWKTVRDSLRELAESARKSKHPLQEFLYLVREQAQDVSYTERGGRICAALADGPLRIDRLAEAAGSDLYTLDTRRLEREGVVLRCGFTPTDAMHVLGDFTGFDREASQLAAGYLAGVLGLETEAFCRMVYEQVERTLYIHLVQTLLENQDPDFRGGLDAGLRKMIEEGWNRRKEPGILHFYARTPLTLVGVGAATHVFLPEAAAALGAEWVVPENAAVANAVGAAACNISAEAAAELVPEESGSGYYIYTPRGRAYAPDRDAAYAVAVEASCREAKEEAARRGARGELSVSWREETKTARIGEGGSQELCISLRIIAAAAGSAGF